MKYCNKIIFMLLICFNVGVVNVFANPVAYAPKINIPGVANSFEGWKGALGALGESMTLNPTTLEGVAVVGSVAVATYGVLDAVGADRLLTLAYSKLSPATQDVINGDFSTDVKLDSSQVSEIQKALEEALVNNNGFLNTPLGSFAGSMCYTMGHVYTKEEVNALPTSITLPDGTILSSKKSKYGGYGITQNGEFKTEICQNDVKMNLSDLMFATQPISFAIETSKNSLTDRLQACIVSLSVDDEGKIIRSISSLFGQWADGAVANETYGGLNVPKAKEIGSITLPKEGLRESAKALSDGVVNEKVGVSVPGAKITSFDGSSISDTDDGWLLSSVKKAFVLPEGYFTNKFNEFKTNFLKIGGGSPVLYSALTTLGDLALGHHEFGGYKINIGKYMGGEDNYIYIVNPVYLNNSLGYIKICTGAFLSFAMLIYIYNQIYFLIRGTYVISINKSPGNGGKNFGENSIGGFFVREKPIREETPPENPFGGGFFL